MNALAQWMAENGVKDDGLAPLVGVSRAQVSRLRRGIYRLRPDLARKLEDVTGIPAAVFVFGDAPEPERAA